MKPLYHPEELCCYDDNSGWVSPGSRTPGTRRRFGFTKEQPVSPKFARGSGNA